MEIKSKTAIRIETTIDLVVVVDSINYRFRAVVSESPGTKPYVYEISFLDKYQVKLKNSLKKKIRRFIKEHFDDEYKYIYTVSAGTEGVEDSLKIEVDKP
jgi:hypothetical protein